MDGVADQIVERFGTGDLLTSIGLFVLIAAVLTAMLAIALTFGWPWVRRSWWARKTRVVRLQATSRVDRFTAIPSTADEQGDNAKTPVPLREILTGSRARRSTALVGRSTGGGAWEASARLKRLADHVIAQDELVDEVIRELDQEMEPVRKLLDGQSSALEHVMANLAQQLETVRAFASSEEANLRALQSRMQDESMRFVAHAFAGVVEEQQERTDAVREQIDRQREPFERFAADERETVELALKRFDEDVAALERALAEERKIALRLLDAVRSDEFRQTLGFLTDRRQAIEEMAAAGTTDPSHIAERLQRVRSGPAAAAAASPHLAELLASSAEVDERLRLAGSGTSPLTFVTPHRVAEAQDAGEAGEIRPAA